MEKHICFISHATEDKEEIVNDLVLALEAGCLSMFYDKSEILGLTNSLEYEIKENLLDVLDGFISYVEKTTSSIIRIEKR